MTCVVFGAVEADSAQPNDGVDADADAEEDVWDAIETVVEADSQKSKKVKREKSEDKE